MMGDGARRAVFRLRSTTVTAFSPRRVLALRGIFFCHAAAIASIIRNLERAEIGKAAALVEGAGGDVLWLDEKDDAFSGGALLGDDAFYEEFGETVFAERRDGEDAAELDAVQTGRIYRAFRDNSVAEKSRVDVVLRNRLLHDEFARQRVEPLVVEEDFLALVRFLKDHQRVKEVNRARPGAHGAHSPVADFQAGTGGLSSGNMLHQKERLAARRKLARR